MANNAASASAEREEQARRVLADVSRLMPIRASEAPSESPTEPPSPIGWRRTRQPCPRVRGQVRRVLASNRGPLVAELAAGAAGRALVRGGHCVRCALLGDRRRGVQAADEGHGRRRTYRHTTPLSFPLMCPWHGNRLSPA